MWFLLFGTGGILFGALALPAAARLPFAPPPEALLGCYFLVTALLRLLVMRARLAAFERKARREARRRSDQAPSAMGELGLGVGRGALQAVAGDVLGAGISLAAALLKGAAHSVSSAPPPPVRERRRAAWRERLATMACILGVGLVCASLAWEPLARERVRKAAKVMVGGVAAWPTPTPTPTPTATPTATPTPTATATPTSTATATATSTATSTATPTSTPTSTPASTPTPTSTPTSTSTSASASTATGIQPPPAPRHTMPPPP